MRVAIAGAGNVGRSIAGELIENGHQVVLVERNEKAVEPSAVPGAEWLRADACELASLEEVRLERCDVVIAATGDDKVNLVLSLLAKTEFAVNRVVARIKDPRNEWLFNESWGVDVAVSSPRVLAALVEEAVSVGDVVRLMTFRHGEANLVELTLSTGSPYVGRPIRDLQLPRGAALVTVLRGDRVIVPAPDEPLEALDELLFVANADVETEIHDIFSGPAPAKESADPQD
ncbi:MAG: potassium channel family protein [Mycobacteriales bacterium]|nr:MAG: potassium transporter TrkA [Pseudonocardiales bacterium]